MEPHVLHYIAEEVERQGDRPIAVYWMALAWEAAEHMKKTGVPLDWQAVEKIGQRVTPKNHRGFRNVPVMVGGHVGVEWEAIPQLVQQLMAQAGRMDPAEVYRQFQLIHPFVDGNGRTGKIIFNWLGDTLRSPVMPPNFFNCSNP